ncbi:DEAD/DEAH box helicase family protein [Flagellimonas sp. C4]|uniref:TOTE conflict system archaeo-eukaryotic primase domain-containing protein n=1 Tax=Flagellimonas alginolytica TaxID=3177515 RepID=UPI0035C92156
MSTNLYFNEKIRLFRSLFKGREDVFATRWEKGTKSGYIPAYFYDPYRYRMHKINGGTFKNLAEKSYLSLTDDQISKHLLGEHLIGMYPLLQDNTSWFIAADFDKENWKKECTDFIQICRSNSIPAYLERSRSGNGGHVWVFFEQPYPSVKSRVIFKHLLEESGAFSIFDTTSSFDRLFPNQDFLSGKGLGNLIALPLHEPHVAQGNSCFIHPESFAPYGDQWSFLKQIERTSITDLESLHSSIVRKDESNGLKEPMPYTKLVISLDKDVRLTRTGMPLPLINFIKANFNVPNPEYFVKKKMGKNVWGTDRTFNLISESGQHVILPRGAIGRLIRFCKAQKIDFEFQDRRAKLEDVLFTFGAALYKHQQAIIPSISKKDFGVIVAPPGSGKTIIALKIIAEKQQAALIVVHRKQLFQQWMERIESFLQIPKNEIGKIGQGKTKIGKAVTVAMVQSLQKRVEDLEVQENFKTVIIDECHHIPAKTFDTTISKLAPYYQYGLTATPFRKNGDGKLIFAHLGELIAEIRPQDIETYQKARVVIRNTDLNVPYNPKTDAFETLSKVLVHDSVRNKAIVTDIGLEIAKGKRVVVITERKEHIAILYQLLKQKFEVISLSGDDSESDRNLKWKILKEGSYQVLVTTGQFFGEGTDIQNAPCLFLVYPFAFKGKLIQYIGRVQRSEIAPLIYDYRDYKIPYLDRLF